MAALSVQKWVAVSFVIIVFAVPAVVVRLDVVGSSPSAAQEAVTEQWVARYNGPGNGTDHAYALAVDGAGNVYVTGDSLGAGTDSDYATVKYDAAGNEQWVARYNGPGNGTDQALALAVDVSGNVYVTGGSWGEGTYSDYATVKYDAAGNEQWVARYDGPANYYDQALALAVDVSGNVYVTGGSRETDYNDDSDYATVKYDAGGNEQWVARYDGAGGSQNGPRAMAVDGAGNVYVTGVCCGAYPDYNFDYATVKYDAGGNEQWVARYNGPGNNYDDAYAMAVDGAGNVYVTGYSLGAGTDLDYATVKYDSAGNQQWVARYNGWPGNPDDDAYALDLAVDGAGSVYVTGYSSSGASNNEDSATVKYDAGGNEQWVARYNGPGNGADYAEDLAVDGAGNVYVTGGSWGEGTGDDYATVKYDAGGNEQWVARYNGPGNGGDNAYALAVDGAGNAYVTGPSVGTGTGEDFATVKYSQEALTPTATPPSAAVGGIAELPPLAGTSPDQAGAPGGGSGWSAVPYAALAGAAAAAFAVLGSGWYIRRRRAR